MRGKLLPGRPRMLTRDPFAETNLLVYVAYINGAGGDDREKITTSLLAVEQVFDIIPARRVLLSPVLLV